MHMQTAVIKTQGKFHVHTLYHASPAPRGTIILVNGSLATAASFAQTVRYLQPHFNVVVYDSPYAGQSKAHNNNGRPLHQDEEAGILLDLIDHFQADQLLSFSWGGASALLALAQNPPTIQRAVVMAFSPVVNPAMRSYLEAGMESLLICHGRGVAETVNGTIGKYLPSLYKRFNYRHIAGLDDHEYQQMAFHLRQILTRGTDFYLRGAEGIRIPVLFVNGALDEYTSPADARLFARLIARCEFATIDGVGHFVDTETRQGCQLTREVVTGFVMPPEERRLSPISDNRSHPLYREPEPSILSGHPG